MSKPSKSFLYMAEYEHPKGSIMGTYRLTIRQERGDFILVAQNGIPGYEYHERERTIAAIRERFRAVVRDFEGWTVKEEWSWQSGTPYPVEGLAAFSPQVGS